ncbi:MAG: hypothetical protein ACRC76_10005 [Proteocatella sp.]
MPMNLDDIKKRTKGTAAEIIAENSPKKVPEVATTEGVTALIGRERVFESNFSRKTYYIHNDLIEKIDAIAEARKGEKGIKTKVINEIIEFYFNNNG